MVNPKVYIILLNWNGYDDTAACIRSLQKITYSPYEIVVVDNGSTDDSEARLKAEFPGVMVLQTGQNLGYAGGNNVGMRYVLEHGAEYVMLLNNDTIVDPGFLEPLVEKLQGDVRLAAISPKIYYFEDKKRIWFIDGPVNLWLGTADHPHMDEVDVGQFESVHRSDRLAGTAMLMPREMLEKVGLLNEDYYLYWEETEWSLRARKLGYELLVEPKSIIWHNESHSSGGRYSPTFLYYSTRNALKLVHQFGAPWQWLVALLYRVQLDMRIFVHLARRHRLTRRQVRATWLGYRDFLLGRRGASEVTV